MKSKNLTENLWQKAEAIAAANTSGLAGFLNPIIQDDETELREKGWIPVSENLVGQFDDEEITFIKFPIGEVNNQVPESFSYAENWKELGKENL